MSYKSLKSIVKGNKGLGSFPLVETPDNMILLGSIPRQHLIKAIERHIGRERRIQAAAKWHRETAARAKEELERKQFAEIQQRRPSRFEVVPVPTIVMSQADSSASVQSNIESGQNLPEVTVTGSTGLLTPNLDSRPKKSILKKNKLIFSTQLRSTTK
jgi:chloride channel 2